MRLEVSYINMALRSLTAVVFLSSLMACANVDRQGLDKGTFEADSVKTSPSIKFDHQSYYLSFVTEKDGVLINEYTPLGTKKGSWDWDSMITVKRYPMTQTAMNVVKQRIALLKPLLAIKPEIYGRTVDGHKNDFIAILYAADPYHGKLEYIILRAFQHEGEPVTSYVYSEHKPLSKTIKVNDLVTRKKERLLEIINNHYSLIDVADIPKA